MDNFDKDFERIFFTLTGDYQHTAAVPWVRNISIEGTDYDQAFQDLWDSRSNIGERFGIIWEEDRDLERMMNAICVIEKNVARCMFEYGIQYAERGFKI